jgi:acyl-CoA reductase-like NAD-dependent aldehyde dehydrogenase
MQVGTVWVNCHGSMDAVVPFGGWKQSGIGVVGGKEGKTAVSCYLLYFVTFICRFVCFRKVAVRL